MCTPFKESWQRDLLGDKGGITDYCVIGEIDAQELRQFQSSYRSSRSSRRPLDLKLIFAASCCQWEKKND
ncbi:hypothetical protein GY14_08975 [Delftia tsuruhatensis]|nr:hypothetical protein GY14_08975 [Delftia tsuruhatensis]